MTVQAVPFLKLNATFTPDTSFMQSQIPSLSNVRIRTELESPTLIR